MSPDVLTIGPTHTLRQAARQMASRHVGAAVVHDPDSEGPGILTERDVLESIAEDQDVDTEMVGDHLTPDAVVATPDWDLDRAAEAMLAGGFRHLVVCDEDDIVGVLSVRDVVRAWSRVRSASSSLSAG
jgi:CBS domain-containing protein